MSTEPIMGIYAIRNRSTRRLYVGSSLDIEKRIRSHRRRLRASKRHHSILLQDDFDLYGDKDFEFEILGLVDNEYELLEREQYYIDRLEPYYNIIRNVLRSENV